MSKSITTSKIPCPFCGSTKFQTKLADGLPWHKCEKPKTTTLPLTTRLRKFAFHSEPHAAELLSEAADRIDELTVKLEQIAGKEMRRVR